MNPNRTKDLERAADLAKELREIVARCGTSTMIRALSDFEDDLEYALNSAHAALYRLQRDAQKPAP